MIYSFSWRKILVALLIQYQNVWFRDNRFATWLLWLPAVCSSCRLQGMFYLFLRFSKVTALFWRSPVQVQKHLCLLSPLTQFPHSNFRFQLFFLFFSYTVLRQCWHQIYLLYLYKKIYNQFQKKKKMELEYYSATKKSEVCSHCGKEFGRRDQLEIHVQRHTDQNAFKCSNCPKTFNVRGDLLNHNNIHKGQRFKCTECTKSFQRKTYLNKQNYPYRWETY